LWCWGIELRGLSMQGMYSTTETPQPSDQAVLIKTYVQMEIHCKQIPRVCYK
jgi:hypothetical protein